MATATVEKAEVVVTLALSEAEARALHALTGSKVVGPSDGPRRHTDAIWNALEAAGISSHSERRLLDGKPLWFNNYPAGL